MEIKSGTNGSDNGEWDTVEKFKHTTITMTMGEDVAYNNIYYKNWNGYCVFVVTTTANMENSEEINELLSTIKISK